MTFVRTFEIIALFQNTATYGSIVSYTYPYGRTPNATAIQSVVSYCPPVRSNKAAPAIAAAPLDKRAPSIARAIRLFGFSYSAPPGWLLIEVPPTPHPAQLNRTDLIQWRKGDADVFLDVLEASPTTVPQLDATSLKKSLTTFADDISVIRSKGCNGRPILMAEYRIRERTARDIYEMTTRYVTRVIMNGPGNSADLSYRRDIPQRDGSVVATFNSLCYRE